MSIAVKNVKVQARVNSQVRDKATLILKSKGITMSDYIRFAIKQAANGNVSENIDAPNERTMAAILEMADDISGKKKLPEAHTAKELERELNS